MELGKVENQRQEPRSKGERGYEGFPILALAPSPPKAGGALWITVHLDDRDSRFMWLGCELEASRTDLG